MRRWRKTAHAEVRAVGRARELGRSNGGAYGSVLLGSLADGVRLLDDDDLVEGVGQDGRAGERPAISGARPSRSKVTAPPLIADAIRHAELRRR